MMYPGPPSHLRRWAGREAGGPEERTFRRDESALIRASGCDALRERRQGIQDLDTWDLSVPGSEGFRGNRSFAPCGAAIVSHHLAVEVAGVHQVKGLDDRRIARPLARRVLVGVGASKSVEEQRVDSVRPDRLRVGGWGHRLEVLGDAGHLADG